VDAEIRKATSHLLDYNIRAKFFDRPLFPSLLRSRLLGSKLLTGTNLQIDHEQVSEGLLAATQSTQKTPHKHVE
jgi:hypothetical protein